MPIIVVHISKQKQIKSKTAIKKDVKGIESVENNEKNNEKIMRMLLFYFYFLVYNEKVF